MSHFVAPPEENVIKICFSLKENLEKSTSQQRKSRRLQTAETLRDRRRYSAHPSNSQSADYDLSLDCSIKAMRMDGKSGLLARLTYPLVQSSNSVSARSHSMTSREALHYAEVINYLLVRSQVFVIQDLDGDRRYQLQMDTLLSAPYSRRRLAQFVDDITQDASVLVHYCRNNVEGCSLQTQDVQKSASGLRLVASSPLKRSKERLI